MDGVRIWLPHLGDAKPDGKGGYTVTLNQENLLQLKNQVRLLLKNGVKYIVAMPGEHVIPSDYPKYVYRQEDGTFIRYSEENVNNKKATGTRVSSKHYLVVPDPTTESEAYQQFMNVQQEYYRLLSEAIPEITHFETINEPENGAVLPVGYQTDAPDTLCPNKSGYSFEQMAKICMDYNYAATQGVKVAGNGGKVLSPALTGTPNGQNLLKKFYSYIKTTGKPVDHYFEILNWHPYIFLSGGDGRPSFTYQEWDECKDTWMNFQKEFYKIAQDAEDDGRTVWFTEMGVTDEAGKREGVTEELMGKRLKGMLETTEKELTFVKNVMVFRITDKDNDETDYHEANYGLIEYFGHVDNARSAMKDTGKALWQFMHNGSTNYETIYQVLEKHYKIFKGNNK